MSVNNSKGLIKIIFIHIIIFMTAFFALRHYKKRSYIIKEDTSISSSEYVFGIDISQYQGEIDWAAVRSSRHPIEFVFIRATMGVDGMDKYFERNWIKAKRYNYKRGAYHYYRPNENSTEQYNNFRAVVKLEHGDLIPVLDIEKESILGREKLREGVLNWLKKAEEEYGVKPIVYTSLKFYQHILKGYIDDYPLWIAAYSGKHRLQGIDWMFHQFSEKVRVKGISSTVDGNNFKGDSIDLDKITILHSNIK